MLSGMIALILCFLYRSTGLKSNNRALLHPPLRMTTISSNVLSIPSVSSPVSRYKFIQVTTPDQVFDCAALCMEVFFSESTSMKPNNAFTLLPFLRKPVRKYLLRQLYSKLSSTMLLALGQPYRHMLQAIDNNGTLLGYAEVYLCDAELCFDELSKQIQLTLPASPSTTSNQPHSSLPKIANLAVSPLARQQGIGTELVNRCIDISRHWGYDDSFLTVEPENTAAVKFYQRMGFEPLHVTRGTKWDVDGLGLKQVRHLLLTMRLRIDEEECRETGAPDIDRRRARS